VDIRAVQVLTELRLGVEFGLCTQPQFCQNLDFYLFHICRRGRNWIAVRRWVWRVLSLFPWLIIVGFS